MSRIPADKSSDFSSWLMPEVTEGQIIQVEKLKHRGPKGQLINVDKDEVIYNSITAAQLEEISNQAYEEVYEQAHQDGLKQGHAEGYNAGLEAAQKQLQEQAQRLNSTVSQVFQYLGGQDDEVEQALINVAMSIASAVLRRELTIDSSQIGVVIQEAVALLPMDAGNLTIFLNEKDHQLLSENSDINPSWNLQIDQTLTAGGCRISSQHSIVDYTLEEQFQQTVNALVEQRFATLAAQSRERNEGEEG